MLLCLKEIVLKPGKQYECEPFENIMRYSLLVCVFIVHAERGE